MYLNQGLMTVIERDNQVNEWYKASDEQHSQLITGLAGSAKTLVMSTLLKKNKKIMIVTPNLYYGTKLMDDLQHIVDESYLHFFPVDEVAAVEMSFSSPEALAERINSLVFLTNDEPGILVTPLAGLRRFLPSPNNWKDSMLSVEVGGTIDLETLPEHLVSLGYVREQMIGKPGEFSIRGSIIDIYPLTSDYPVRIDLFDDEVDSLRLFDAQTQRSLSDVEQITIPPAMDQIVTKEELYNASKVLDETLGNKIESVKDAEKKGQLTAYKNFTVGEWENGHPTEDISQYIDVIYDEKYHLSDYLSVDDFVLFDDYSRMIDTEKEILREEAEWLTIKLEDNPIFENRTLGGDFRQIMKRMPQHRTFFSLFQKGMGNLRFSAVYPFEYRSMQQFFGQLPLLKAEMDRWAKQKQTVVVLVENDERSQTVERLFIDAGISVVVSNSKKIIEGQAQIQVGLLESGFELPQDNLVVVVEKEILHTRTKRQARKQTISNAERLKSYNELSPGDYVVHANHGIGKYIGMETLLSGGTHQDYMTILYQNNDKLFIPVTQLDLIQKYVASEVVSGRRQRKKYRLK